MFVFEIVQNATKLDGVCPSFRPSPATGYILRRWLCKCHQKAQKKDIGNKNSETKEQPRRLWPSPEKMQGPGYLETFCGLLGRPGLTPRWLCVAS
jgi:hypothetical protein